MNRKQLSKIGHLCDVLFQTTVCSSAWVLSSFSCVLLFATLRNVAMLLCPWDSPGENWIELSCLPPGDLADSKTEPTSSISPALQADSLPTEPPGKPICSSTVF